MAEKISKTARASLGDKGETHAHTCPQCGGCYGGNQGHEMSGNVGRNVLDLSQRRPTRQDLTNYELRMTNYELRKHVICISVFL